MNDLAVVLAIRIEQNHSPHSIEQVMDTNTYPVVDSAVNLRGPQFTTNRKSWDPLINKFETLSKAATSEGNDKYLQRHQDRGQLLGINNLLYTLTLTLTSLVRSSRPYRTHSRLRLAVPGTLSVRRPWPERCTGMWKSHQWYRKHMVSNGSIDICSRPIHLFETIWRSGRPCLVLSHIPTQNGGAWSTLTSKSSTSVQDSLWKRSLTIVPVPKQNRVTEIAIENNLPIVALVQSVWNDRLVAQSL